MHRLRQKRVIAFASLGAAAALYLSGSTRASQGQVREFTLTGDHFAFAPGRLEVQKDDLVKITFNAADMPHSFTIDSYRIAKRAGSGQRVVFEFRADQAGTFPFYCNLTQDERCRQMKGELVVR